MLIVNPVLPPLPLIADIHESLPDGIGSDMIPAFRTILTEDHNTVDMQMPDANDNQTKHNICDISPVLKHRLEKASSILHTIDPTSVGTVSWEEADRILNSQEEVDTDIFLDPTSHESICLAGY